jgi:hypothetical protein
MRNGYIYCVSSPSNNDRCKVGETLKGIDHIDNVHQNQTERGQNNDQLDDSNQYDDNDEELALLQTTLLYNDIMVKQ